MVPTPVGNLEDMTARAIKVLGQATLILAEDTRTSAVLMKHYGITTPMRSHHKFNEHETVAGIIAMLEAGDVIALVTDAGTPGISDPGFMLARACREKGITVETLPGATAFVPALVNSGLPCERFAFEGFLPTKKGRASRLEELAQERRTMIFYESPMRLVKTLEQLAAAFGGDRQASVSREISKIHESTCHGTLQELAQHYKLNTPRGEIVIVVAGKASEATVKKDKYAQFKNKYSQNNNCDETL